jgi:hypothetical protein
MVYKVDTVAGERVPYMRLDFVESTKYDLAFATEALLTDDRHPEHPSCTIKHHVEYHYDRTSDRLEVQPEDVQTDVVDGKCVINLKRMADPMRLVRADRSTEARWSRAPVGVPEEIQRRNARELAKKQELERKQAQLNSSNDKGEKIGKPAPAPEPTKPPTKPLPKPVKEVPTPTKEEKKVDEPAPTKKAPSKAIKNKQANDDEDDAPQAKAGDIQKGDTPEQAAATKPAGKTKAGK